MSGQSPSSPLRLVRSEDAVSAENRAAAQTRLEPTDPRWVIAAHAHAQLQGAVMTPDRRRRVQERARQLGLRPFDANVIVAIVQENARRGVALRDIESTLAMLPDPRGRSTRVHWFRYAAAAACAVAGAMLLIRWVGG